MTIAQAHSLITAPQKSSMTLSEHQGRMEDRKAQKREWIQWHMRQLDGRTV